jgi:hypothetical protein
MVLSTGGLGLVNRTGTFVVSPGAPSAEDEEEEAEAEAGRLPPGTRGARFPPVLKQVGVAGWLCVWCLVSGVWCLVSGVWCLGAAVGALLGSLTAL